MGFSYRIRLCTSLFLIIPQLGLGGKFVKGLHLWSHYVDNDYIIAYRVCT